VEWGEKQFHLRTARKCAPSPPTAGSYVGIPNRWSGVHGSHGAPLPRPGELQGALFFTSVAPLDEKANVMFLNGNRGRGFVMTTDGLYPSCLLKRDASPRRSASTQRARVAGGGGKSGLSAIEFTEIKLSGPGALTDSHEFVNVHSSFNPRACAASAQGPTGSARPRQLPA
jgi:hypothetical protein